MLKRTPLFAAHQRLGGKLIEFGGWEIARAILEHHRRSIWPCAKRGIFDISHMGEVTVGGPEAEAFLNQVLTNDCANLSPARASTP